MVKRKIKSGPLNNLWRTAVHEAGHAVAGRVLTLVCGGVSIKRDYTQMTAGFSITEDPRLCAYQWEVRGKYARSSSTAAVWRARIITYMAGAEAEILVFGSAQGGDGDDRYQIDLNGRRAFA